MSFRGFCWLLVALAPLYLLLAAVVPIDLMPLEAPAVRLIEPAEVRRFRAGMTIDVVGPVLPDGPCRVTDPTGALLGIGIVSGSRARPKVVLPGNPESDIHAMLQVGFVMKNGAVYKGPQ